MKKLLAIIALGLLFSGNANAVKTFEEVAAEMKEDAAYNCPGVLLNKKGYCKSVNQFLKDGFKIINTANVDLVTIISLQKRNTLVVCHVYRNGNSKCTHP
jgi:hypothetical protein